MKIIIPGPPIPKKRPRFGNGIAYDIQKREKTVTRLAMVKNNPLCLQGALDVSVEFCFLPAPSKRYSELNLIDWGFCRHDHKPDIDNLLKFLLDCANKVLWNDDAQVTSLTAVKRFSKNACTIIEINEIPKVTMSKISELVFKTFSPEDIQELADDAFCQYFFSLEELEIMPNELKEKSMDDMAARLVEFADRWIPKFKKIQTKEKKNA